MSFGPTGSTPIASPFFLGIAASTTGTGKPVVFKAIPQQFEFQADGASFMFKAIPSRFTFRGRPK